MAIVDSSSYSRPEFFFFKKNGFLWRSLLFIRDSENNAECRRLTSGSDICLHSFHPLGLPSSVCWLDS